MHIDVYCTGSDAEGDDSSDDSSSSSASHSKDHLKEDDSTATPQTVYDNSKYRLHHKRIDNCKNLPRRMGGQSIDMHNTPSAMPHSGSPITPYNLREFLLSKSDTKDEVNESKQMLFNKHIGLTSDYQVRPNQRFNTRNRFRKDNSDGCLSSNYPNSSRSTVRDFTSSSISSALASNSAIYDDLESSWKETDADASIAPSESFEYDNKRDRQRIRAMDQRWGRNQHSTSLEHERKWDQNTLSNFIEEDINISLAELPHLTDETKEYKPNRETALRPIVANSAQIYEVNVADGSAHRQVMDRNSIPQSTTNNIENETSNLFDRQKRTMFYPIRHSASQSSSVASRISGYTMEHLMKAKRFGSVVPAIRKPGHHVGPVRNPDCLCDHCRRWVVQRDGCRERAMSLEDSSFVRTMFWPGRHYQ